MEQESKSNTNTEKDTGNKEEAFTHLAQGKRHLLVKDYEEAVTSLGLACTLLSKLYGEFANECGEAYFNYGKALLELARSENGVLGVDGDREDSEDSDEGEEEESETKNVENGKEDSNKDNTENSKEDENKDNAESNKGDENKDKESESKSENEANGTKDGESKDAEEAEEEDVDNLHLAWEMLEMAKIVFKKQAEDNKQMNLKLAEVHLKLGEVGLESENYSQAIEDINTCLQIQLENLDKHDRYIAETHYQLGIAYALSNEFDNSIEQYNHALKLLEERIKYLQEREKQGMTSYDKDENNPFYSVKEEISEINALLPEVREKIADVEDSKMETKKALLAGFGPKKEGEGESSSAEQGTSAGTSSTASNPFSSESSAANDAKPISNISHLVRKKRKLETDSSEEKSSKQPCPGDSKPE
ncbi:hypothetical protein C0J52_03148 [Blattella germanica]|nr:hypothetical protein C0J52_03148 [Blattella germanica]